MQTLFFVLGVMAGTGVSIYIFKYRQLRAELNRKCFENGVLTQQVATLEMLLKEWENKNEIQTR